MALRLIYDQGTLLLHGVTQSLSETLGSQNLSFEFVWDDRVEAYRAPAWRYPKILQQLNSLNISFQDEASDFFPRPFSDEATNPGAALRPYQQAALESWQRAGHNGIVVLPTGAGKTRVGLAAMGKLGKATLL